jgi:prepilin-type N-terminal cleavage/methylation domain-containing protein
MLLPDCRLQIADCRLKTQLQSEDWGLPICNLQPAIYNRRPGFTLLEVVLAISLSVVLLSALYLTLNLHYRHAKAGRELTDEAAIVRSVLARINDDINGQLSPMNPLLYSKISGTTIMGNTFGGGGGSASQNNSAQNSSTPNSSSPNSSTPSSSSKNTQSNSSQSSSSPSSSAQSTQTSPANTVVFNLGVFGDADRLVLTGSWLPKDLTRIQEGQTQTSDLRRVVYWLVKEGNKTGLARQELSNVTAQDAGNLPPEVSDPGSHVIAPEVTKFSLEYFDGTQWQTSWDGTALDASSSLPIGPPALIAVNITIVRPAHAAGEKARETSYRHVVAIPSANIVSTASP